jgi:prevent-host-death family protein
MTAYPLTAARTRLGELVAEARHTHRPVTITEHGKPVVAVINVDDLADLEDGAALAKYLADKKGMRSRGVVIDKPEDLEAALDRYEADGTWG